MSEIDIYSINYLKKVFKQFDVKPSRRWGQNFLLEPKIVRGMLEAARVKTGDHILEIGGGFGALTLPLAEQEISLTVFEVDPKLRVVLEYNLKKTEVKASRLRIVAADILEYDLDSLPGLPEAEYKILGLLPYGITSPLLHRLIIKFWQVWQSAVFMLQKEVADKIIRADSRGNYWNHFISRYCEVEVVKKRVSPRVFWPRPGVESSLLKFRKRSGVKLDPVNWSDFLHRVFKHSRKKISASFTRENLEAAGISPDLRPEKISSPKLRELYNLTQAAKDFPPEADRLLL